MAKKMTAVERENTKFNVMEVVTEFNVPQSAKVVLHNVRYHDLPKNLQYILQQHIMPISLLIPLQMNWQRNLKKNGIVCGKQHKKIILKIIGWVIQQLKGGQHLVNMLCKHFIIFSSRRFNHEKCKVCLLY